MPLIEGASFGRYRILARVGRGGMGEVYRAEDTSLRRVVALKTIRPDLLADEGSTGQSLARFEREARVLASFSHPNVVTLFAFEQIEGIHVLAMEWIVGSTVHELLRQPLVRPDRMRWLRESGAALAAMHRVGIVHRDFKPANMIVDDAGRVRLLDFGLARALETPRDVAKLTATHDVVGTPRYMAPEQLLGAPVDGRADQFAWGLVAYELLTGRHPRDLLPPEERPHFPVRLPPSSAMHDPHVSDALSRTLLRALAASPEDRFPTMEAALAELDASVHEEPAPDTEREAPAARPSAPSAARRARPKPAARSGVVFLSSVGLVLVAGAAGAVALGRSALRAGPDATVTNAAPPLPAPSAISDAAPVLPDSGEPAVPEAAAPLPSQTLPSRRDVVLYRAFVVDDVPPEIERAAYLAWFTAHDRVALRCMQSGPPPRACPDTAQMSLNCNVQDGLLTGCMSGRTAWEIGPHANLCGLPAATTTCVEKSFNRLPLPPELAKRTALNMRFHPVE